MGGTAAREGGHKLSICVEPTTNCNGSSAPSQQRSQSLLDGQQPLKGETTTTHEERGVDEEASGLSYLSSEGIRCVPELCAVDVAGWCVVQ